MNTRAMKIRATNIKAIGVVLTSTLLFGCVGKIVKPDGPTATVGVGVINFSQDQSIFSNEHVFIKMTQEGSDWGGQQVVNKGDPLHYNFSIPANKPVSLTVNLLQGGVGFDSVCGLALDLNMPELKAYDVKFTLIKEDKVVVGCTADLYDQSSSEPKLLQSYKGGSSIRHFKAKFVY